MIGDVPEDRSDRENAADPRWNVALEASAGTGKTRVLVDRYLSLFQQGADPRHILAITFTRKAAGEMKARIIDELRRDPPLWKTIRDRLFDIHIATIDAFCLGLLKEFPLEAGLDPDIGLLDEVDTERLAQQAIEEVWADVTSGAGLDLGFLISVLGEASLRRGMRDFLRSRLVREEVLSRFVSRAIPRDLRLDVSLKNVALGLRDVLAGREGIEELLDCGPSAADSRFQALAYAFERVIDPGRASPLDVQQVADYYLTQEGSPRKKLPVFTRNDFATRDRFERHRDLVLARAPDVAEVVRRWLVDRDLFAVREIWRLYGRALRRFSALKESHRGLDFTDVLVRAVELLEQLGEFSQSRFRLESRYHHILIDEFQDTNQFQWRLVTALIGSWGEGAGLVQETILAEQAAGHGRGLLREPTIFIVGDRKQSIYGWRDARVEVMEQAARYVQGLMPGRGKRLRLRRSFRSRGSLLAFLNDVFAEMPQARDELEWTFRYRDWDHFPVSASSETETTLGLAVGSDVSRAASAVADEIVRLLVEADYQPKDIAVLFRSRTHYRAYEDALAERGVPTYVYRGLGFFDSPEVRDIQALVRFLAEPGSELRAAELARSRFVRLSDTGLAHLASRRSHREGEGPLSSWLRGRLPYSDIPADLSMEDRSTVLRTLDKVSFWLEMVDRVPPADLIEQALHDTDYAAWFSDPKSGRQGWENLKKILEMVRRAQNRGYLTLSRLAEYLEHASSGDESLAVLEAIDAVSLMTIHAAKGLEFRAAFVVNLDQKTKADTSLPRITELAGEAIEVHALQKVEAEGPQRNVEEEKRLLYVALTRPRDYLVLSAAKLDETEGQTTLFHLLPEGLRNAFHAALTTDDSGIEWKPKATSHRLRILRPMPVAHRYDRDGRPTPDYHVAMGPLGSGGSPRTTLRVLVQELAGEEANPWTLDPVDLSVGAAVHRLFEYQVPVDDSLEETARAVLPDSAGRSPSEQIQAARRAADLYKTLHGNPALTYLLGDGRVFREVPFCLHRDGRVLCGAMDALVLQPERAVVIDYKTGAFRLEHRLQMELYLEAARALLPGREVEGLVFYPTGEPLRVRLPEGDEAASSQWDLF